MPLKIALFSALIGSAGQSHKDNLNGKTQKDLAQELEETNKLKATTVKIKQ
ncbi:MAG: hypothetical protein ACOWWO_12995 [Peptococcaceae bacterium]